MSKIIHKDILQEYYLLMQGQVYSDKKAMKNVCNAYPSTALYQ